jgi:hypothetical protein
VNLGLNLGLGARPSGSSAAPFNPASLFAASEQGAWYDPSDITTLFQDDAGTTPVTAAGQSVGLMLDKSGRGNHATQANLAQRPLYQIDSGGRPYLLFDGSDDSMATGNINPGAIDKAQVFAGLRKLSDAARGILVELSNNSQVNTGAFLIDGPRTNGATNFRLFSRGTTNTEAVASPFAAPITSVLTGISDIAAPSLIFRVDGTQVGSSTATQGTGNYLTYPLLIGRRGGASIPFNGRIYGLLVRFGANLSAAQIDQTEAFMAAKTGVTIP